MKRVVFVVLITLITFISIYFFIQPYYIYSNGMAPNIENGDIVLLLKHPKNYTSGDVVVYENGVELVGEIKASPGDKIEIIDKKLYINEAYINEYDTQNMEYVLGEDEYLVINNANFGYLIDSKQIKGEVR